MTPQGTRFSPAAGRRFGGTVGAAFLVLAGILWWRGSATGASVVATLGGLLVLAGLVAPTRLGPVERGWMALAHAISKVTTPIVMAIMYGLVIAPIGALRRGIGRNPLVHAPQDRSFWRERPVGRRRSASMQRQY